MSAAYVEIELSNPDAETRTEIVGPFSGRATASRWADSLGRAAGLTMNNPNVPGFWVGGGEYLDGNGYTQSTFVTIMVRTPDPARVRPAAKLIKGFLRGED